MLATIKGPIIDACYPFCDPNVFDDMFFIIGIAIVAVMYFHLPATVDQCVGCFVPNIFNFLLTFVADVAIAFDKIIVAIAVVGMIISHFVYDDDVGEDNFCRYDLYLVSFYFMVLDAIFNLRRIPVQKKKE